jgi:hypothetical protein
MKIHQIVLAVIVILSVNNLLLLSYLGYFSEKETSINAINSEGGPNYSTPEPSQFSPSGVALPIDQDQIALRQALEKNDLNDAIENYIKSEQFTVAMDDWQLKASRRFAVITERLAKMDAPELYISALEGHSRTERAAALNSLFQNNRLAQLSSDQLKDLYINTSMYSYGKNNILKILLENDDSEALSWAKSSITDDALTQNFDSEIYSLIYDKDPEFVKIHLAELEFEPSLTGLGILSFMQQEPGLASSFYGRNFDKILDSKNNNVFIFTPDASQLTLNDQQQSRVAELFSSNNRHKRNFAIGLAPIIEDTQLLRDAYSNLSRNQDKMMFIMSLMTPDVRTEASDLARELAKNSDEPNIRRLLNTRY